MKWRQQTLNLKSCHFMAPKANVKSKERPLCIWPEFSFQRLPLTAFYPLLVFKCIADQYYYIY